MRIFAAAMLACACAPSAGAIDLAVYPDATGMPADVQDFIVQHSDCQHWLGETSDEPVRQREVNRTVRRICPGLDARLTRLRARHAGDPAIIARLASYEMLGQ
jgi:hypothetical protein